MRKWTDLAGQEPKAASETAHQGWANPSYSNHVATLVQSSNHGAKPFRNQLSKAKPPIQTTSSGTKPRRHKRGTKPPIQAPKTNGTLKRAPNHQFGLTLGSKLRGNRTKCRLDSTRRDARKFPAPGRGRAARCPRWRGRPRGRRSTSWTRCPHRPARGPGPRTREGTGRSTPR